MPESPATSRFSELLAVCDLTIRNTEWLLHNDAADSKMKLAALEAQIAAMKLKTVILEPHTANDRTELPPPNNPKL